LTLTGPALFTLRSGVTKNVVAAVKKPLSKYRLRGSVNHLLLKNMDSCFRGNDKSGLNQRLLNSIFSSKEN
jgi:hypothetical protein